MNTILSIFAVPIAYLLKFIYGIIGNYGISIIILTLIVKCALYPLYKRQIKASANMMALQPRMAEIQEKYANDREKMNEEMSKLYTEGHFNPMGGCLPMLIQMPIIMGLFALLRNPMQYMSDDNMILAVHESFLWVKDLAQPDLWILPILAGLGTYLAFSMQQKLQFNAATAASQTQSMNLMMKYFFPVMILFLARSYPAGLAIYWAGGQFIQIFFNLRMGKIRNDMREEQAKEERKKIAEKLLDKKRKAYQKGIK